MTINQAINGVKGMGRLKVDTEEQAKGIVKHAAYRGLEFYYQESYGGDGFWVIHRNHNHPKDSWTTPANTKHTTKDLLADNLDR